MNMMKTAILTLRLSREKAISLQIPPELQNAIGMMFHMKHSANLSANRSLKGAKAKTSKEREIALKKKVIGKIAAIVHGLPTMPKMIFLLMIPTRAQ